MAGLEQQAYHVFTSNSKAAVDFSKDNPGMPIVGSVNNGNIAAIYAILNRDSPVHFLYMSDMPHQAVGASPNESGITPGFAVLDRETMAWGKNSVNLNKTPTCWEAVEPLVPTGFGFSHMLMGILYRPVELLPRGARIHFKAALENLSQPSPATVYRVNMADFWCERGKAGREHSSSN